MTADDVLKATAAIEQLGFELGKQRAREIELEDARAITKVNAIQRIMNGPDNPLTGKKHSASSAETMVESDDAYLKIRDGQQATVLMIETLRAKLAAAKVRAELALHELKEHAQ